MSKFAFTVNTPPFVSKSVCDSIRSSKPVQRQNSMSYSVGTYVYNQGKLFVSTNSGTTGSSALGPTHSTGLQNDGSVSWLGLGPYFSVEGSITNNLFLCFGRNDSAPWDDDEDPPAPTGTPLEAIEVIENLSFGLKIDAIDVSVGFPKNEWVTGTAYPPFDPSNTDPTTSVVTVDGMVYKCIDCPDATLSTTRPTGETVGLINTPEGYIWKYLGSVSPASMLKFETANFLPVPDDLPSLVPVEGAVSRYGDLVINTDADFGGVAAVTVFGPAGSSGASAMAEMVSNDIVRIYPSTAGSKYDDKSFAVGHYDLDGENAVCSVGLVGGSVDSITVTTAGSGYSSASVVIYGDGTGAVAQPTITGTGISSVTVINGGSGYTWARAVIVPGTKWVLAPVVLSPSGGHGTNLEAEIGSTAVIISKTVAAGDPNIPSGSDTVDGTFRQISLISGVKNINSSGFMGKKHPNYSSPQPGQVKYSSGGNVLYVNNIEPVEHTSSQEEVVKIVLNAAQGICP